MCSIGPVGSTKKSQPQKRLTLFGTPNGNLNPYFAFGEMSSCYDDSALPMVS